MKKSQIAVIIFAGIIFMCAATRYIYLGYTNGSDKIVLDTVEGTVEEYHVHNGAAFVTLEGQEIVYRASTNGDYDKLGLQERPLLVGENVEILFEDNIRGGRYPIVGIATDTWRVSIEDAYLKGWDNYQLLTYLFSAFFVLAGMATILILVKIFRKINQNPADDGLANNDFGGVPSISIIKPSSPKGRILMHQMYNGLDIVVKRVFGATKLVVDGMVYAEKQGMIETNYTLEAFVKNTLIRCELQGSIMFLYADGNLLKKKMRIV